MSSETGSTFSQIRERLAGAGSAIGGSSGWLVIVLGVLVLSTAGLLMANALNGADALLLSGLDRDESTEVSRFLLEREIPFSVSEDGSAIFVPASLIHSARLDIAGAGLTRRGTVALNTFGASRATGAMSEFAEQAHFRRRLESELQKTIRQLDSVEDARVHVVVPTQAGKLEPPRAASRASVTVQLRRGRRMLAEHVEAVTHLIAYAVPGLDPNRVTVVDTAGHVLTTGDDSARRLSDVLRLQREIESGLAARVQGLIEHALGPGTATVTVSADVDFDRRELRTESFDPEEPVLRSENMLAPPRAGTDAPPAYVQESPATTLAPGDGGSPPYRQAESREFEISNTSEVRVST
ncbi:MAG: flagellar basal-body MS-ring/collar protein FliF, partial [Myxococcota bacterium]